MLPVVNFVKWNFFWSTGLFLDSIVTSRLDYCNALLSGAPAATFDKLQRAQNNMSRVTCHSRSHTDARPLLHTLHWLPVRQQVTYKLAVLTHKVQTTATPTYLSELVQTHAPLRGLRALRSSDAPTLVVPRIHTELARRAFSVAAPSTWTLHCAKTFSLSNAT